MKFWSVLIIRIWLGFFFFFTSPPSPLLSLAHTFPLLLILSLIRVCSRCLLLIESKDQLKLEQTVGLESEVTTLGTIANLLLYFLLTFKICPCWVMSIWQQKETKIQLVSVWGVERTFLWVSDGLGLRTLDLLVEGHHFFKSFNFFTGTPQKSCTFFPPKGSWKVAFSWNDR